MKRLDERDNFKAFLEQSGLSLQAVADAVNALGGDKRGKPVDRRRVWNYTRGTLLPEWFVARLNEAYPRWREGSAAAIESPVPASMVRTLEESIEMPEDPPTKLLEALPLEWSYESPTPMSLPVLPPVGDRTLLGEMIRLASPGYKPRRTVRAVSLLGRLPFQPIVAGYSPAFSLGDAVLLLPRPYLRPYRLYLVSLHSDPLDCKYAVLRVEGEEYYWIFYGGGGVHIDDAHALATVVAHLPGDSLTAVAGTYDEEGLRPDIHLEWPRRS